MANLYIIGTGSQARYIIENLRDRDDLRYVVKGLLDIESGDRVGKEINGHRILGHIDDLTRLVERSASVIVAYGNNLVKKQLVERLTKEGYQFATVINKRAYVADHVKIGQGSIVNPNVTIMPNAQIGNHVIIHSGSVIEHDNRLEDFCNIAPGVSMGGNVTVGEGSYVYTGAVIIPGKRVGRWAKVGAGAVVIEDVPEGTTVVGNPARVLKK